MKTPRPARTTGGRLKPRNLEELIRHFILDHSEELFVTNGYERTSMDMIAQECGLSKPTLYTYFKNKHELFTSLVGRLYGSLRESLEGLLLREGDKRRILEEFIDQYFSLVETKKSFLKMYFQENPLIHENVEEQYAWQTESRRALVDLLSRLLSDIARPEVRKRYSGRLLAAAVLNMMRGLMSDVLMRGAREASLEKRLILEMLDRGVLAGED